MKQILSLILAILLTVSVLTACGENNSEDPVTEAATEAETNATVVTDDQRENIKSQVDEIFTDHAFKGAAYMVYQGEEVYAGGVGKANKKEDIDNSADVVYHIASITKQFTAAAILKLCEQGKMSLDDTLSKYYPDYEIGGDITVHNLLSMQSGIPDFVRSYDEDGYEVLSNSQAVIDGVEEDNTMEENCSALREWIFSQELLFEQGDRFSYSNSNYFLLGEIIEKVSGISYFDYLRTNFFEPVGMTTAGFMENYDNPDAIVAKGYHHTNGADLLNYDGVAFGCGDMMASPKDMYKWSVALHSGKVLGDEMYQKMTAVQVEGEEDTSSYGYGLMIAPEKLFTVYFHSGSIPCFLSCVMYVPEKDLFIAVMSNYSSETMTSVTKDMLELYLKEFGVTLKDLF